MSRFVYKVSRDLESIYHLCINPIRSNLSIRVSSGEVYTYVFYLAIVSKVFHHCHFWLARQYLSQNTSIQKFPIVAPYLYMYNVPVYSKIYECYASEGLFEPAHDISMFIVLSSNAGSCESVPMRRLDRAIVACIHRKDTACCNFVSLDLSIRRPNVIFKKSEKIRRVLAWC